MSQTVTLAHLSDIHLGPLPALPIRYLGVKRGLGYLNWHRGRRRVHRREALDLITADLARQAPDHIAVTGDLVNIALPQEFENARAWLQDLGPAASVSVVPGNHDIYTTLGRDAGVARWRPFMSSDAEGLRAGGRGEGLFPYVRRVGPLALIGLNSAVPTPPFVASGRVGAASLGALGGLLDRLGAMGLVRVLMIHHPPLVGQAPPSRALQDAADLEAVLRRHGVEVALHGHNHRDMLAWREGPAGRFVALGIASASAARLHHGEPLARYALLVFKPETVGLRLSLVTRGLSAPDGPVAEIARRDLGVLPAGGPAVAGHTGSDFPN